MLQYRQQTLGFQSTPDLVNRENDLYNNQA